MPLELHAALGLVGRLGRGEIRLERRLHVNDDVAPFGHVHDEIRAHGARRARLMRLLGEVHACRHAGEFDQPPQRDLTPLAAHVGTAQSGDEIAGLARQQALAARERFDLGAHHGKRVDALALDGAELRLGLDEGLANRLHQGLDGRFALAQCLRRVLLLAPEPLARELQEHLAVVAQAVAGQLAEHPLHFRARPGERRLVLSAPHGVAAGAPEQGDERAEARAEREAERPRRGVIHKRPLASSQGMRSAACARSPSPRQPSGSSSSGT